MNIHSVTGFAQQPDTTSGSKILQKEPGWEGVGRQGIFTIHQLKVAFKEVGGQMLLKIGLSYHAL